MTFSIIIKLFIGLISLLIVVRLQGKKSMNSLTPYDFVYSLVLGGLLEESIYDPKVSFIDLAFAIALWGVLIYGLERLSYRFQPLSTIFRGIPSTLVYDNKLVMDELKRNNIELCQLRNLLRQENIFSLKNAKHVILETGGQISAIACDKEDEVLTFMVIDRGKIEDKVINDQDITLKDLENALRENGYQSAKEIIYAEWSKEHGYYFIDESDLIPRNIHIDG